MNLKHGRSADPIYRVWRGMLNRCYNPRQAGWNAYGGRGIWVCERWRQSFGAFLGDMGERPAGTSLERVDNDKGYEPGNVIWATLEQQNANKRSTRTIVYQGQEVAVFLLAKQAGLLRDTLLARLRLGYSAEEAVAPSFDSHAKRAALAREQAAARSRCARGHELTAANTYLYSADKPIKCCKQCRRDNRLRRLGRFCEPQKPGCVRFTVVAA